jgi:murein DD-endopeptidase MepM/ murein hydrolase activator NlpD
MSGRAVLSGVALLFSLGDLSAQVAFDRPVLSSSAPAPIADRFDFPVGKPDGAGYYKARGFSAHHPGEDWDGIGGGNSDLNDPINSIADGVVIFAEDVHRGWGNVVIVRHQFREQGEIKTVDALFAHLNSVFVRRGDRIVRGQRIGTMGTAHGLYSAHLHFELRKNLEIGLNRAAFPCDFSCYYNPTKFIAAHRGRGPRGDDATYACNRVLTFRGRVSPPAVKAQPPHEPPADRLATLFY